MEVSSTSMNVAKVTVSATSHGLWLGFQLALVVMQFRQAIVRCRAVMFRRSSRARRRDPESSPHAAAAPPKAGGMKLLNGDSV